MLHLGSSTQLHDPISPALPQSNHSTSQAKEILKKQKIIQVNSLDQLTFERFLHSDMRKFYAQVVDLNHSLFGASEFLVEIRISNIPPFQSGKTYEQFRAFYKALKLRFPNIQWPDFPPNFQFTKKFETRKAVFNRILEEICIVARMQDTYKKSILGIFYAFFLGENFKSGLRMERGHKKSSGSIPEQRPKVNSRSVQEIRDDKATKQIEDNINAQIGNIGENDNEDLEVRTPEVLSTQDLDRDDEGKKYYSMRKFSLETSPAGGDTNRTHRCHSFQNSSMLQPSSLDNSFRDEKLSTSCLDIRDNDTNENPQIAHKMSIDEEGDLEKEREKTKQFYNSFDQHSSSDDGSRKNSTRSLESRANAIPTADTLAELENTSNIDLDANKVQNVGTSSPNKDARTHSQEDEKSVIDVSKGPTEANDLVSQDVNEKREIKKAVNMDMEKVLRAEVPRFAGNIYVKLSSSSKWTKYFARIQKSCLTLYPTIMDNFPHHFIPCFRAVVKYMNNPLGSDYIEFYHHYDAEKFQIVIDINSKDQNDARDPMKNLQVWAAQLKIASEKVADLNLSENYYYQPVGKLQLVVCDVLDVKGLPNRSSCFVRINHRPFALQTSKALSGTKMKWKQSFFIPLCDVFFPITIDLVCAYSDGWITESQREEVICSIDIPVQDLLSLPSQEPLHINLPFKYTELKKPKATKGNENEVTPKLTLKINNMSSVKSYFAPAYGDYVEGVKMDSETFTKQLFKLSLARMRRIISWIILFIQDVRDIYHHKYPLFSYICLLLLTYFVAFFQISDLVSSILLALATLCFYKHPKVEPKIKSFMMRHFFNEESLNPNYKKPKIQTLSDLDLIETFNIEKWRYKLRDDESLVSQIRKAKKSVVILTVILTKISGFCEKLKNLILWQDQRRSLLFGFIALVGYCIFEIVPLRAVIMIGVWTKFIKGAFYFSNLRTKNTQVATAAVNFVMKKSFLLEWRNLVAGDLTAGWPPSLNVQANQRKIIDQLKDKLDIDLSDDTFQTYKTPQDLIDAIATCKTSLKFKEEITEQEINQILHHKEPKFKAGHIMNFIMNVPSDYYRVIQPKVIDLDPKKND